MFQILKQKIEDLEYKDSRSLTQLRKLVGAADLFFGEEAWSTLTIADIYRIGKEKLQQYVFPEYSTTPADTFISLKSHVLDIMNEMTELFERNNTPVGRYPVVNTFGVSHSPTRDVIDFELRMVEQNNIAWFQNRPARLQSQPHDRLHNHYVIHTAGDRTTFYFVNGTDVPDHIQQEAHKAFEKAG